MKYEISYSIFPLGDSSITLSFSSQISKETNQLVLQLFNDLRRRPLKGMIEAVPAYSTLSVHFDIFNITHTGFSTAQEALIAELEERLRSFEGVDETKQRTVHIPVCFDLEFASDLEAIAIEKQLNIDEIISIFTSQTYRVYMLGFLPGFPYLGAVDERIKMSRKAKPVLVNLGSVAITGNQAGIYPVSSPGGWHIIGRTPLPMIYLNQDPPTFFNAGDNVIFYSISKDEYQDHQTRNS